MVLEEIGKHRVVLINKVLHIAHLEGTICGFLAHRLASKTATEGA